MDFIICGCDSVNSVVSGVWVLTLPQDIFVLPTIPPSQGKSSILLFVLLLFGAGLPCGERERWNHFSRFRGKHFPREGAGILFYLLLLFLTLQNFSIRQTCLRNGKIISTAAPNTKSEKPFHVSLVNSRFLTNVCRMFIELQRASLFFFC